MEISGDVESILDDRVIVRLSGRKQRIDVFLTPNRKELLKEHIVIVRSLVTFNIEMQTVEVEGDKLGKLWLNYIVFPTSTVRKPMKRSKNDDRGSWAEDRQK